MVDLFSFVLNGLIFSSRCSLLIARLTICVFFWFFVSLWSFVVCNISSLSVVLLCISTVVFIFLCGSWPPCCHIVSSCRPWTLYCFLCVSVVILCLFLAITCLFTIAVISLCDHWSSELCWSLSVMPGHFSCHCLSFCLRFSLCSNVASLCGHSVTLGIFWASCCLLYLSSLFL